MERFAPMPSPSPSPTAVNPLDKTGGGFGQQSAMSRNYSKPHFNPNRIPNGSMDDNNTQAPILLGLGGTLLFISICLLAARLWSRLRPTYRLKLDDWTVLGATVRSLSFSS